MYREAEKLDVGDDIYWFAAPNEYEENDAYREGYITGAFCGDGSVPDGKTESKTPETLVRISAPWMKRLHELSSRTPKT